MNFMLKELSTPPGRSLNRILGQDISATRRTIFASDSAHFCGIPDILQACVFSWKPDCGFSASIDPWGISNTIANAILCIGLNPEGKGFGGSPHPTPSNIQPTFPLPNLY